jgi:hypothetical protein
MQEDPFVFSFASIYNAPPHELDSRVGRLVKLIFKELRLIEWASVVWEGLSGMDYCLILFVLRVQAPARCPVEMNDCQRTQRWNNSSSFSLDGRLALSDIDAAKLQRGDLRSRDRS